MTDKIAPCIWFDGNAEEAVSFYCDLFDNSKITSINRAPMDWPGGNKGDAITVEFSLLGSPYVALNGGPDHKFTEAISLQVFTETQEETDRYWDGIVANGGAENLCSWCSDRFGLHWQIVPRVLMDGIRSTDPSISARVFEAMGAMTKINHAAIEAAAAGS